MGGLSRLVRPFALTTAAFAALALLPPHPAGAEPTGSAGFAELDVEATESAGSIRITVLRSGLAAAPGTVDYATRDGSARGGLDFGATAGTVAFGVGEVAKTISISLVDDRLVEPPERFEVALSNPRGAIGSVGAPVIVTVQDDDGRTTKGATRAGLDTAGGASGSGAAPQVAPPRRQVVSRAHARPRRAVRAVAEPAATPFEVRTPAAAAPLPQRAPLAGGGGLLALLASVLLGSIAARVWMRWLLARAELEAASVRS